MAHSQPNPTGQKEVAAMKNRFWSGAFGKALNGIPPILMRSILSIVPLLIFVWILIAITEVMLGIFAPIIGLVTKYVDKEYHLAIGLGMILMIVLLIGMLSWLLDRGMLKVVKKQWIKARDAFYRAVLKSRGRGMVVKVMPYDGNGAEELGIFVGLIQETCDGIETTKAKVSVPGAPIPITGMVRLFPLGRVWTTNLTLEDLVRQITSFGLAPLGKELISRRLDALPSEELIDSSEPSSKHNGAKS